MVRHNPLLLFPLAAPVIGERQDKYKAQGSRLIKALSDHIGFPWITIMTAHSLFHRYMHERQGHQLPLSQDLAVTCLFVASKAEETVKKSRLLLRGAWYVMYGSSDSYEPLDPDSDNMEEYRRRIMSLEKQLLHSTHFLFEFKHPQVVMLKILKQMQVDQSFGFACWKVLDEAYGSSQVLLHFPAHYVALSVILVCCKMQVKWQYSVEEVMRINGLPYQTYRLLLDSVCDNYHAVNLGLIECMRMMLGVLVRSWKHATINISSPTVNTPFTPQTPADVQRNPLDDDVVIFQQSLLEIDIMKRDILQENELLAKEIAERELALEQKRLEQERRQKRLEDQKRQNRNINPQHSRSHQRSQPYNRDQYRRR